jgi:hypothetical protein
MDYPYRNPEVRDLAWACFEPPLLHSDQLTDASQAVSNCRLGLTGDRLRWLGDLDEDPEELQRHLANIRSHRLGIYFEALWHFFLQQDRTVDLIAHNLPVRLGGKTLGEFDCLYYCHQRKQHVHLELAVKYFMGRRAAGSTERASPWREWWGPECRDRLDLKIRHLMDRQIQLADHPASAEYLTALGIGEVAREVEVKGYLFQSIHDPLAPPRGYNLSRPMSNWVHVEALAGHCNTLKSANFITLPKRQWLSPALAAPGDTVLDKQNLLSAMLAHFEGEARPLLIAALDDSGVESSRFFVAGNDWPPANI